MVELLLPKQLTRVPFPSPAPASDPSTTCHESPVRHAPALIHRLSRARRRAGFVVPGDPLAVRSPCGSTGERNDSGGTCAQNALGSVRLLPHHKMTKIEPAINGYAIAPAPERHHIEATRSLLHRRLRVLKQDDLFGVFDMNGGCRGGEGGPDGLFFHDTRFLSGLSLRIGGMEPLVLGSVLRNDNRAMVVDLTNADFHHSDGDIWLQRDSIHVGRVKFLSADSWYG